MQNDLFSLVLWGIRYDTYSFQLNLDRPMLMGVSALLDQRRLTASAGRSAKGSRSCV